MFKEGSRQASPKRFAPGGIDAQSVALQTIRRRIVTLENLDTNFVQLQPLRQTQATGACANDHHLERFANHDSSAAVFFILPLPPPPPPSLPHSPPPTPHLPPPLSPAPPPLPSPPPPPHAPP